MYYEKPLLWLLILTCDLLVGPKIQLGGFFTKVKEEALWRELLKAINGEDLIVNCARRLGIRLNNFKCKLYTARIHGIECVLTVWKHVSYWYEFILFQKGFIDSMFPPLITLPLPLLKTSSLISAALFFSEASSLPFSVDMLERKVCIGSSWVS